MRVLSAGPSLALLCVLASCGGDGDTAADRALASLVPADAVVYVRLGSLDDVVATARTSATAFGANEQQIDADAMLGTLGPMAGDVTQIDMSRPLAFALVAPRATQPTPLVIVPAYDPAKYAASLEASGMQTMVDGGYVVVSLGGKYAKPVQPTPLCAAMPAGLVAMRVDVAKAAENLGTVIGGGLTAFKAMMSQAMQQGQADAAAGEAIADMYVEGARALLGSGRMLDLVADAPNGQLQITASMHMKPGSELDGWGAAPMDLSSFAGVLSGKGAADFVMAADWKGMWPRIEAMMDPLWDVYPKELRAPMRELMQHYKKLYETIGPAVVGEVVMGQDGGLGVIAHMAPPDAPALMAAIDEMTHWPQLAQLGVSITPQDAEAGGAPVRDYRLAIDRTKLPQAVSDAEWEQGMQILEKMVGKDGLQLRFASKAGRTAVGLGTRFADVAGSLATTGGSWPRALRPAMAFVGDCNPMLVERLDFMAMMGFFARMMPGELPPGMTTPPAGSSADMVMAGGIRGAEWRASFSMDLLGFGEWVKAMMPR